MTSTTPAPRAARETTRAACLAALTLTGVVLTAVTYQAQPERAPITGIQEVAQNLYLLADSDPSDQTTWTGGNTAIFVTGSGVVLVDTKLPGYGADILEYVRGVSDLPVTTIINTHTHFDHSGSNTEFPETVQVIAHENTAAQMARSTCDPVTNCAAFQGANAKYLPRRTFSVRTSLFNGPEQIDLYHFGRGHTNGDTFVVFRAARTVHTGDLFQRKALPFVDVASSGGSAVEFGRTLTEAVAGLPEVDTVIAGHVNEPLAWQDFTDFAGFYNHLLGEAEAGAEAGRSVDEVVAAYAVPDAYDDFSADPQSVRTIVQHIYDEQ